jgi:argininosuccinate lyase
VTDRVVLSVGRLGIPPDEVNQRDILTPMLAAETPALQVFLDVDLAHAVMLTEQEVLDAGDGAALVDELLRLRADQRSLEIDPTYDTLLLQVERHLGAALGEDVAGRLHTGRSRNDDSSTVDRIVVRTQLVETLGELAELQRVLLGLASAHVETLMPGYTHLQHAQPSTLAHYLMRYHATYERDQCRLEGAFGRVNLSALGLAAMAGTSWPLNRERTADLLGHEGIVRNGQDAGVFSNDYTAEVAAVLSILTNNLARMAMDLYIWSTYEFGMVEVSDGLAGTSSIMPQKKNPHPLERVLGLGGAAVGWLPSILGATRGSSSDLSINIAGIGVAEMLDLTRSATRLITATLETLRVNRELMAARAGANWSTASNLADELVRRTGISFRSAHQVVGRTVRTAIERGVPPDRVTAADVDVAGAAVLGRELGLTDQDVHDALDAAAFIRSRVTPGSPHPDDVAANIAEARAQQREHTDWVSTKAQMLAGAQERLLAAATALAAKRSTDQAT